MQAELEVNDYPAGQSTERVFTIPFHRSNKNRPNGVTTP